LLTPLIYFNSSEIADTVASLPAAIISTYDDKMEEYLQGHQSELML
jgi:hypothetical protein